MHSSLCREFHSSTQAALVAHDVYMFVFLAQVPSLLSLFTWGLGQSSSGISAKAPLREEENEGKTLNIFSTLLLSTQYFSTPSFLSLDPHGPQSDKTTKAFCLSLCYVWNFDPPPKTLMFKF